MIVIHITIEGDETVRSEARKAVEETGRPAELTEEKGFDGAQILSVVFQYGPDALLLLTALVKFVDASVKLKRTLKMTTETRPETPA
jgi:hypothetical protein